MNKYQSSVINNVPGAHKQYCKIMSVELIFTKKSNINKSLLKLLHINIKEQKLQ